MGARIRTVKVPKENLLGPLNGGAFAKGRNHIPKSSVPATRFGPLTPKEMMYGSVKPEFSGVQLLPLFVER